MVAFSRSSQAAGREKVDCGMLKAMAMAGDRIYWVS